MIRAANLRQLQSRLTAALDRKSGQMLSGSLSVSGFFTEAEELLSFAHNRAAFLGTARANRTGSVDIAAKVARDAAEEQRAFLLGFVRDLTENRYGLKTAGKEGANARLRRFALYSLRLNGTANEAWKETLLSQKGNVEALWVRHANESCQDCIRQASLGWRLLSTFSFMPGEGKTACIVRCKCTVKTREGEQSYAL